MTAIVVESLSGNTKRIAEIIQEEIGGQIFTRRDAPTDADFYFIGTFTVDYGKAPKPLLRWIDENPQIKGRTAVFGSGETQWGEENFCGGAEIVAKETETLFNVLKIEHYPISKKQIEKIRSWANGIERK